MDERDGLDGVLEAVLGDDGVEVESFARRRAGGDEKNAAYLAKYKPLVKCL
ncbi:MAG: hypothetical protein IJ658_07565 [Kiritimatiellae bacterium]|nr:hypothetical protein [Kiritimatiellia bacterium]